MKYIYILFFISFLTFHNLQAEQYIRSSRLYLYPSPTFKVVPQKYSLAGDLVTPLETKGLWVRVIIRNQEGWVSRMSLIDNHFKKSLTTIIIVPKPLKLRKEKKRVRVRVSRTLTGVKGLRESQSTIKEGIGNYEALKLMVARQSDQASGIKFLLDYTE